MQKITLRIRASINVVFLRVTTEKCKILSEIKYKIVLRKPSFIDKTLRSFTDGCYLAYKIILYNVFDFTSQD